MANKTYVDAFVEFVRSRPDGQLYDQAVDGACIVFGETLGDLTIPVAYLRSVLKDRDNLDRDDEAIRMMLVVFGEVCRALEKCPPRNKG